MENFLKEMARQSAERAAASQTDISPAALDKRALPLRLQGFDLIAEIKNRSPAEGSLATAGDSRAERAMQYVDGGAAAISVLTEPVRFAGELGHLEDVVAAVSAREIPVMRKDFLVEPVQVLEAKAAGASGVLLIAAILDDRQLTSMLDCAFEHELFVLLEAFDELDMKRAAILAESDRIVKQAGKQKFLIGVNTRDLRSLEVDGTRLQKFAPLLPQGIAAVAESGLKTAADAAKVAEWGYDAALVGTALMRADKPGALIGDMLSAARDEVAA
jgi:indole-3-glycerol phosphate synthase